MDKSWDFDGFFAYGGNCWRISNYKFSYQLFTQASSYKHQSNQSLLSALGRSSLLPGVPVPPNNSVESDPLRDSVEAREKGKEE
jgi:hypothetical protein